MKRTLPLCIVAISLAACVSNNPQSNAYDPASDVSPIQVSSRLRPVALSESKLPADTALVMAAVANMVRGETVNVGGLRVAPGIDLAEPGVPLENFGLVNMTLLDRTETEVVKGTEWETRNVATLDFGLGPFRALMIVDATSTVSARGVVLERASVRALSPAQPRTVAWFVPKKEFQAAIEADQPMPVWDLMDLVASMSVPVGAGKPVLKGDYQAVTFVLDRLEPGDTVKGWASRKPVDEPGWAGSVDANAGVGFPIAIIDSGVALNDAAEERYVHVSWIPADIARTGGTSKNVPIGRFSTIGATFKTAVAVQSVPEAKGRSPIASGARELNVKVKADATIIQQRLIELGYLKGKADGAFGKGSRAALAKFRDDSGLGVDGAWDMETQQELFRDTDL